MHKANLVATQSEKGGCGKTTVNEAIVAGLVASGMSVLVVDADDGNSGYIRRAGEGSAVPLSWSLGADALSGWLTRNFQGQDVIVIDCGANLIASGAPVNEFLGELVGRVVDSGGRVVPLAIASTNAPGTGRLVKQMRQAYGDFGEVRLIRNDQDGSGAFSRSLGTLGMKSATFEHIWPGFQAARLSVQNPLLKVLTDPPRNYRIALAHYARATLNFLRSDSIQDLLGQRGLNSLEDCATAECAFLPWVSYSLRSATDQVLQANQAYGEALTALRKAVAEPGNESAIVQAARALHKAEAHYDRVCEA